MLLIFTTQMYLFSTQSIEMYVFGLWFFTIAHFYPRFSLLFFCCVLFLFAVFLVLLLLIYSAKALTYWACVYANAWNRSTGDGNNGINQIAAIVIAAAMIFLFIFNSNYLPRIVFNSYHYFFPYTECVCVCVCFCSIYWSILFSRFFFSLTTRRFFTLLLDCIMSEIVL